MRKPKVRVRGLSVVELLLDQQVDPADEDHAVLVAEVEVVGEGTDELGHEVLLMRIEGVSLWSM